MVEVNTIPCLMEEVRERPLFSSGFVMDEYEDYEDIHTQKKNTHTLRHQYVGFELNILC